MHEVDHRRWLRKAKLEDGFYNVISGKRVQTLNTLTVVDPTTGQDIATIPSMDRNGLEAAVKGARTVLPYWSSLSYEKRKAILLSLGDRITEHSEELSALLCTETGRASSWEIQGIISELQSAIRQMKQFADAGNPKLRVIRDFSPLGVVCAISPWNIPALLAFSKVFPALAAGNTVVLKPSRFAPLTVLRIGEYFRDLLPPGVFNVLTGGDLLGPWMTSHPAFDKISMTGSNRACVNVVMNASAKRVTVNGAGNDPAIILPDAKPEEIAERIFRSMFMLNGCSAIGIKRLYVPENLYQRVSATLVTLARKNRTGYPFGSDSTFGPIQNKPQYEHLLEIQADIIKRGMPPLYIGEIPENSQGFFLPMMLLDNPEDDAEFVTNEVLGPIRPMLKYKTIEEAIGRANASSYDLGASVWGSTIDQVREVASQVEAKTLWFNQHGTPTPRRDFDGLKGQDAGLTYGREGLEGFCEVRESGGTLIN